MDPRHDTGKAAVVGRRREPVFSGIAARRCVHSCVGLYLADKIAVARRLIRHRRRCDVVARHAQRRCFDADIQGDDLKGSTATALPVINAQPNAVQNTFREIKWFDTLRGRLGRMANDRVLVYGIGGLAFGEVKEKSTPGSTTPIANNAAIVRFQINCTVANNC